MTLLGIINGAPDSGNSAPASAPLHDPASDKQVDFVRAVLASTEDVWTAYFQQQGKTYTQTDTGAVQRVVFIGLRPRQCRGRPVLLPGRSEGLSRPGFLPATRNPVRRALATSPVRT